MILNNRGNKIEVKNDELLKYVNYILKQKGINKVVKNISVDFHERQSKGKNCFSRLVIKQEDKDIVQTIKKENIVFNT